MKRLLLFGGRGLVGQAIARAGEARGCEVLALGRNDFDLASLSPSPGTPGEGRGEGNPQGPAVRPSPQPSPSVLGEGEEPVPLRRLIAKHRPNVIFNCAAVTDVNLAERDPCKAQLINADAVGALALAATECNLPLVQFSSDYVFDGRSAVPYREADAPNPLSEYGRSKLRGDELFLTHCPTGLLLRTAWLFGQGGRCFPQTILDNARAGKKLQVVADQTGSPTFVDDLADAAFQLLERRASGVFHVVNAGSATWFELARETLRLAGMATEIEPVSTEQWQASHPGTAPRPRYSVLDASRAAGMLGRPYRGWREALAAWARSI